MQFFPLGRKKTTGATCCCKHSPFYWRGERGPLQLVHPDHPERTSRITNWTIQLLFTHSLKIVAEPGLEPISFDFKTQVEVGKLAVESEDNSQIQVMVNSGFFHMTYLGFQVLKWQVIDI